MAVVEPLRTPKTKTTRRAITGLVTGIVCMVAVACHPVPNQGHDDWTKVGGDEFNESSLDTTNWKAYHNTYGDGNNEMACLTPGNLKVSDGSLKITSKKATTTCPSGSVRQYTSGFIGSREVKKYYPMFGRFEIRAKVPHSQGLWPAFWLRHRNGAGVAEVDILEYFHSQRPGKGSAALHLDGKKNVLKKHVDFEAPNVTPGWHTWSVDIAEVATGIRFQFYMDGKLYGSYIDTVHKWASVDKNATWDIAVNQAVGGNPIGGPDDTLGFLRNLNRCSISGTAPNGCTTTGINRVKWGTPSSTTYEIDWVRVWTR